MKDETVAGNVCSQLGHSYELIGPPGYLTANSVGQVISPRTALCTKCGDLLTFELPPEPTKDKQVAI